MEKYTTKQFADLVGVSSSILRRLHKQGHFKAFQVPGGRSIYSDEHVEEFKKRFFNTETIVFKEPVEIQPILQPRQTMDADESLEAAGDRQLA
jgi:hypothetical protein